MYLAKPLRGQDDEEGGTANHIGDYTYHIEAHEAIGRNAAQEGLGE